ncbi:glycoside hydrolase family 27 protein [Isoptericola variabilis]|uniref:Alpha-galactosidase n=1 Tax=Isoptericola variabilis (strain 225) TaxID=743718 RepID=F6FX85_ISOV2|nr:glycoside hydrolase family 27 protein [Isoptericola variabilis]AEG43588.1 putative alpha-galactosidase [Isoptericola variabilis 225]TWH32044.1 Alpha-galactosidase [Isoptericola variabilis J7]
MERSGTAAPQVAPPMGWNSWDSYGTTVTEDEVLANARFMAERMADVGWDTVVVDIQWYEPTARAGGYNQDAPVQFDERGFLEPVIARFPSADGGAGFAPLAAAVHDLGLRFGIHLMRGIARRAVEADLPVPGTEHTTGEIADRGSTCPWNPDCYGLRHDHPGAQAWLDAMIEHVVGWGVDFLKVDDMLAPYHADAIEALSLAVRRAELRHGRRVTVSLSPGTELSLAHLEHLREHADMWRVSDDLWDRWEDVEAQLTRLARWAPHSGPAGWADADMLPLGRIGLRAERGEPRDSLLTADERRTMLSLWCLARSPLFVGGDLPTSDAATIADLTNPAVLDVARGSGGGRELLREGDLVVWGARGGGERGGGELAGARWAGVFNTGREARRVRVPAASADLPGAPEALTDVWTGERVRLAPASAATAGDTVIDVDVPAHGVRLLRLDADPATDEACA